VFYLKVLYKEEFMLVTQANLLKKEKGIIKNYKLAQ